MTEPNYINPAPGIWIDTGWRSAAAPDAGRIVLAAFRNRLGKWRIVRACYYGTNMLPLSPECEAFPGCTECEASGEIYAPSGWYEEVENADLYGEGAIFPIDSEVEYWQPLPPPPAKEAPEPGTLITGERDCAYNGQGTPEDALRENR